MPTKPEPQKLKLVTGDKTHEGKKQLSQPNFRRCNNPNTASPPPTITQV